MAWDVAQGFGFLTDPVGDDRGSPHATCAGNSLRAGVNDLSSHSGGRHVVLVGGDDDVLWK